MVNKGVITDMDLLDCQHDYSYEAPKVKIVDACIGCGELIYEGEIYYDIKGMIFCKDCMKHYKRVGAIND
ncbi:hypothetical protein 10S11_71 [uncultured Caudovirales phage]|uniref:Uncharacterized protein n=1 Tax=uncultured Caudovirales phage TaxID=2100421 RepID=A0A2H4J362_9CAUD|nr:hypothetical protein 10S11_71 [uncultured Caudovirales phage]